jgi:hypothetical protein
MLQNNARVEYSEEYFVIGQISNFRIKLASLVTNFSMFAFKETRKLTATSSQRWTFRRAGFELRGR